MLPTDCFLGAVLVRRRADRVSGGGGMARLPTPSASPGGAPRACDFRQEEESSGLPTPSPSPFRRAPRHALHGPSELLKYPCPVCCKPFASRSKVARHFVLHTGERPFVCQFCGKGFQFSASLSLHVRTHTGEKPYVCDQCGVRMACSSNLVKHKRFLHGAPPGRPRAKFQEKF